MQAFLAGGFLEGLPRIGGTYDGLVFVADFHAAVFLRLGGAVEDAGGRPLDGLDLWDAITGVTPGGSGGVVEREEIVAQVRRLAIPPGSFWLVCDVALLAESLAAGLRGWEHRDDRESQTGRSG